MKSFKLKSCKDGFINIGVDPGKSVVIPPDVIYHHNPICGKHRVYNTPNSGHLIFSSRKVER